MADITNLSNFLGDVADAIRSKKGSEESIPAKNFDEEILSIETGIDTSDADATEENIEKGKTAYVNGLKVTGTLADAGGSADIMVSADNISVGNQRGWDCVSTKYTNSGKKIHRDGWYVNQHMKFEDLAPALGVTADKIAKGNTILGIEGTAEGDVTTTDATATKDDIIYPKTAYVNGEKIIGNIALIEKAVSSSTAYHTRVIKTGFYSPTYYDAYAVGDITMFAYVYNSNLICVVMRNDTLLLEKSFAISEAFSFSTVQAFALNLVSNTTSQIVFDVGIAYRNGSVYHYSFNTLTVSLLDNSLTLGTKISTSFSGASGSNNTLWSVKTKPGRFVSIIKYNSDDYFLYVTTNWSTKKATATYASLYHGNNYNPSAKITGNYKWLIQPKYAEYLNTNTTTITGYSNAAGTNAVYISPGNKYMFVGNVLYKITPSTNYTTMYNSRTKIADIVASTAFFTENEEYLYVRATSSINIYKLTTNTATLVQTIPYTNHTLAYIYGTTSFLVFDGASTELVLFYIPTSALTVEGLIRQGQNFIKLTDLDVPNTSAVLKDVEYKDQNGDYIKGTMPNNGNLSYTPSTVAQTIPAGYTSGGTVAAINYEESGTITPAEYTELNVLAEDILGGVE